MQDVALLLIIAASNPYLLFLSIFFPGQPLPSRTDLNIDSRRMMLSCRVEHVCCYLSYIPGKRPGQ